MSDLQNIPLESIVRNPDQPRRTFDEASLAELADSIRQQGIIQPIEVEVTVDGRYMLHHGERRTRAAGMAGLETIPAVIANALDEDTLLVRSVLENLHREELNPIDEARAFQALLALGWPRTRITRELGKNLNYVAGRLKWLQLEEEIQQLVALGHIPRDPRLADALLVLPSEARVALAGRFATAALSFKACLSAAEKAAEKIGNRQTAQEAGRARMEETKQRAHAVPMVRHAAVPAQPTMGKEVRAAADAMCRSCHWRPSGTTLPAWQLVEEAAAAVCADCVKRDGPALPSVCQECPGVALVKLLAFAEKPHGL